MLNCYSTGKTAGSLPAEKVSWQGKVSLDFTPLSMAKRTSSLTQILRSPARILAIVLVIVFTVEVAVMFVLPYVTPGNLNEVGKAVLDAMLLTAVCAPVLWWIIIGPLRRIAVQEYERSQTIVANAGEGIFTFDSNHVIVSCNRAGAELFGGDAEQWIGKSMRLAIPMLPVSFSSLPVEERLDGVRKDGDFFPIHVSISEYPSENQNLSIMIVRDLTESQAAEKEKIAMAREAEALRAQQMATLAQLATGVAHEIRNPLTSIKMLVQVNRAKFKEEGQPTSDMELVEQEIRRMERSINHLLDYARPEKSELRRFPVQHAVHKTIHLVEGRCNAQRVKLHTELPDTLLEIVGDPEQIQQLLLNLSLNALDAMPDGGDMHISVACSNGQVNVIVADTGEGISEQMLDRLFTPFVTTKPNGVGLGLGICRRIATAHGGTLNGTNLKQGGAQFTLTIPLAGEVDFADHAGESEEIETGKSKAN